MEIDMKIFILEVIMGALERMTLETIGVYTTKNRAIQAMQNLPAPKDDWIYNIEEFKVDDCPRDIFKDHDKDVQRLMKDGLIDQLVGEDGRFYYILTDLGNEIAKKINIKIDKNDDKNQSL
jgi:hypothetical protein